MGLMEGRPFGRVGDLRNWGEDSWGISHRKRNRDYFGSARQWAVEEKEVSRDGFPARMKLGWDSGKASTSEEGEGWFGWMWR